MTSRERALPTHPVAVGQGTAIRRLQPILPHSRHDATFGFCDGEDIALDLEYSADLYAPEWMERVVAQLDTLVHSLTSAPERSVALASMLTAADLAKLEVFEARSESPHADRTVLQAFEQRAREQSDDPALWVEDGWWTYRSLASWIDGLAAELQLHHGAQAGTAIAVACDRSAWNVVAMFAVWRAGAVLGPVPANWHNARREPILLETGVSMVLVDPSIPAVD